MAAPLLLAPLFFATALVYATAGLAGGSTYLALLAFFSYPYESLPKVALFCNLIVAAGGLWFFHKAGYLSLKRVAPFLVSSIPMAYLGGLLPIGKKFFTLLLAISLLAAALRLLLPERVFEEVPDLKGRNVWLTGLPIGLVLGLVSGLVGIGGGIFLSPLLMLLSWANSKQAAASASLFILLNSLAGLAGQFSKGGTDFPVATILPLLLAVFLGGQIGSRLGSQKITKLVLQRLTAVLVLLVSGRLFYGLVFGGAS